jgi:hypothetical protein
MKLNFYVTTHYQLYFSGNLFLYGVFNVGHHMQVVTAWCNDFSWYASSSHNIERISSHMSGKLTALTHSTYIYAVNTVTLKWLPIIFVHLIQSERLYFRLRQLRYDSIQQNNEFALFSLIRNLLWLIAARLQTCRNIFPCTQYPLACIQFYSDIFS